MKNDKVTSNRLPTAIDWANVLKRIPIEDVKIDETGHYDPKLSPSFYDWMLNG